MARPRQWQNAERHYIVAESYAEHPNAGPRWTEQLGTRRMARWNSDRRNLFYPSPNGYNDPVSIAFVLDALIRIPHEAPIRATWLASFLNAEYTSVVWDATCVGRILGELAEEADEDARGRVERAPIRRAQDYKGNYFWTQRSNPELGLWTGKWLSDRREWMGAKAREAAKTVRRGQHSAKSKRGLADNVWADYAAAA